MIKLTIQSLPDGNTIELIVSYENVGDVNAYLCETFFKFKILKYQALTTYDQERIYHDHKDFLKTNGFLVFKDNTFFVCSSLFILCYGDQLINTATIVPMVDGEVNIANLEILQDCLQYNPQSVHLLRLHCIDQNKNPSDIFYQDKSLADQVFKDLTARDNNNNLITSHSQWTYKNTSKSRSIEYFLDQNVEYYHSLNFYNEQLRNTTWRAKQWIDLCDHTIRTFVEYILSCDMYKMNLPLTMEQLDIIEQDKKLEFPILDYQSVVHLIILPMLETTNQLILYPTKHYTVLIFFFINF